MKSMSAKIFQLFSISAKLIQFSIIGSGVVLYCFFLLVLCRLVLGGWWLWFSWLHVVLWLGLVLGCGWVRLVYVDWILRLFPTSNGRRTALVHPPQSPLQGGRGGRSRPVRPSLSLTVYVQTSMYTNVHYIKSRSITAHICPLPPPRAH